MTDHPARTGPVIRLEVTSDSVQCAVVRQAVCRAAQDAGMPEDECGRIVLAVDEAVTNIIRHGYQGRGGQPIVLEIAPIANQRPGLQFILLDRGRQVEPETIVGRRLEDVRPGGLGTHIIRSVMDVVEYAKRPGGGMQLRMVKYLPLTLRREASGEGGPAHDQ